MPVFGAEHAIQARKFSLVIFLCSYVQKDLPHGALEELGSQWPQAKSTELRYLAKILYLILFAYWEQAES